MKDIKNNNRMSRRLFAFLVVVTLLVTLSAFVAASYGVASRYSEVGRPLEAYPGQTVDTFFVIQNTVDEQAEITVDAAVTRGGEIASITSGGKYTVPWKEQEQVDLRVSIPGGASIGTEYIVEVLFKKVASDEDGEGIDGTGVGFSFNVDRAFVVKVVEKPAVVEEERAGVGANVIWWIIGIIVLIIVVWLIVRAMKGKEEQGAVVVKKR